MKIGYARVSSNGQNPDGQVEQLKAAGCARIFAEKMSGKTTNGRREFERMLKTLKPGDTVVVVKLDRLARSSRDLANILHDLGERSCGFLSLREAWCDTTTPAGKLMFVIMGGIAEFERELIRARCDEGIARARAKGTKFGPKFKLEPSQVKTIAGRYAKGETMAALAKEYGVSEPTVWRALQ